MSMKDMHIVRDGQASAYLGFLIDTLASAVSWSSVVEQKMNKGCYFCIRMYDRL